MSPKTKANIKNARRFQLALRLCELVGALGLLFCVISINKTAGAVTWIIRVGPGVALLHTVYGVYHLSRNANSRPPTSTASYMLFAILIDAGLLPFLAYSALISHGDYTSNAYGWNTLFNVDEISYKIIFSFFLLCVTEGGLLIISLLFGVYLATVFRKIAKLPPDMNPLESNLTARPHHKRNKSELNSEKPYAGKLETRLSDMSDPSVSSNRRVPFVHTRTDSADSITLYGNNSARNSKAALVYQENEYRKSQSTLVETVSRPASAINPAATSRPPGGGLESQEPRSSLTPNDKKQKKSSWLSYMKSADYEGACRAVSGYSAVMLNEQVPHPDPVSPMHLSYRSTPEASDTEREQSRLPPPRPPSFLEEKLSDSSPQPTQQQSKKRSREPLGMNPPTPRLSQFAQEQREAVAYQSSPESPQRGGPLQTIDTNTPAAMRRASSFVGSGGKSRFYGDLRRSISSVSRQGQESNEKGNLMVHDNSKSAEDDAPVSPLDSDDDDGDDAEDHLQRTGSGSGHSHIEIYMGEGAEDDLYAGQGNDDDNPSTDRPTTSQLEAYQASQRRFHTQWSMLGQRQTSNSTGYDLRGGYAGLGPEFGKGMAARRREVSGKVAEEGRVVTAADDVSASTKTKTGRAAGWARFKGL